MAKKGKAPTAKIRAKKKAPKKQSRREVERVLDAGPIRRTAKLRPKTQHLPGMEGMALIASLDRLAESLADIRLQLNEIRAQEKGQLVNALRELRKHNRTVYKAHGIELVRVPGEERVRVRLVAGQGAADTDPDEEQPNLDNGEGDDAGTDSGRVPEVPF